MIQEKTKIYDGYDGYMDEECITLCDKLNSLSHVETTESCCGHCKEPYMIFFDCDDFIRLGKLYRCVNRNYSDGKWRIECCCSDGNPTHGFLLTSKEPFNSKEEMMESVNNLIENIDYWENPIFDDYFKNMKTIEEKAKAYDEAIKVIKDNLDALNEITETSAEVVNIQSIKNCFYRAFPELAESEDERIRKTLIDYFNTCHGDYYGELKRKDILAWLEKQGEQKPIDKVEPKFKNGQWIVWRDKCYKVNYNGCGYELVDQDGLSTSLEYGTIDENAHLWDVTTDAKDGDVLQLGVVTAIFQKYIGNGNCKCYCSVCDGIFEIPSQDDDDYYGCHDATPATKEQRELLFKSMKDDGYEWDAEKLELKEIELKPIWNKNDENYMKSAIEMIMHCI